MSLIKSETMPQDLGLFLLKPLFEICVLQPVHLRYFPNAELKSLVFFLQLIPHRSNDSLTD